MTGWNGRRPAPTTCMPVSQLGYVTARIMLVPACAAATDRPLARRGYVLTAQAARSRSFGEPVARSGAGVDAVPVPNGRICRRGAQELGVGLRRGSEQAFACFRQIAVVCSHSLRPDLLSPPPGRAPIRTGARAVAMVPCASGFARPRWPSALRHSTRLLPRLAGPDPLAPGRSTRPFRTRRSSTARSPDLPTGVRSVDCRRPMKGVLLA
jgi:hypothetical protein